MTPESVSSTREPAEAFCPADFIWDEMKARDWSINELARRMGGDPVVNVCALELGWFARQKGLLIGPEMAAQLARAFGTSAELWLNMDAAWQKYAPKDELYERNRALQAEVAGLREQLAAAGVVTGEDAEIIQREIAHGTPDTPERIERIRSADEIYRRVGERSSTDQ